MKIRYARRLASPPIPIIYLRVAPAPPNPAPPFTFSTTSPPFSSHWGKSFSILLLYTTYVPPPPGLSAGIVKFKCFTVDTPWKSWNKLITVTKSDINGFQTTNKS